MGSSTSTIAKMTKPETQKWVDDMVSTNQVMVFAKSHCPFCKKAVNALQGLSPSGMVVENIESRPDMDEIQDYLKTKTGARSVPRVFIKGEFLGGGDETVAAAADGSLAAKLKSFGAIA
eukprot:GHVT01100438.1.p1 GENE.GHVT01100438.1~~GHVT01100438.1.p1  ORF type:complete len:119 (-),score=13.50 GHVT01100438.1:451-807(-)